jgi:hypothetical protein
MSKVWKMKNLIATKVVLDTRYEKKKSDTFPVKRLAAMALRATRRLIKVTSLRPEHSLNSMCATAASRGR